jgi:hypothetical protein
MASLSLLNPDYGEIIIKYTPQTITFDRSSGWQSTSIPGSDDPMLTWSAGGGLTISFEAEFVGTKGIKQAERLQLATTSSNWVNEKGVVEPSPPRWSLYKGGRIVPVIVDSVSLDEGVFKKNLEPGKILARVSLRKYVQYLVSAK